MTSAKYVSLAPMSILTAALLAQACEGDDASSQLARGPGVILVDRTEGHLAAGAIQSINGTYMECLANTGAWSVAVFPGAELVNPPLQRLQADAQCKLVLTEVVVRPATGQSATDDVTYVASPEIVLESTYVPASFAGFRPTGSSGAAEFYGNARLAAPGQQTLGQVQLQQLPLSAPELNIEFTFSSDPDFGKEVVSVPSAGTSEYTFNGTEVAPTTYVFDARGKDEQDPGDDFQVIAEGGVTTVVGSATLVGAPPAGVEADGYVLTRAALSTLNTVEEVEAAYAADGPPVPLDTPILGEAVTALLASTSPAATSAAIVIRAHHAGSGVAAYQVIRLQFGTPSQPACGEGEDIVASGCVCSGSGWEASEGHCCPMASTWDSSTGSCLDDGGIPGDCDPGDPSSCFG